MPKTITRYPAGFLSLLGVQSDGQAPNQLSDSVIGTLDLEPFVTAARIGVGTGDTTASLSIGGQATNTANGPGVGELWVVQTVAVFPAAVLGAATTYSYQPALFTRGNIIPLGVAVNGATAQQFASTITFDSPLVMNPGDQLGVWVSAAVGVAAALRVISRVTPVTF